MIQEQIEQFESKLTYQIAEYLELRDSSLSSCEVKGTIKVFSRILYKQQETIIGQQDSIEVLLKIVNELNEKINRLEGFIEGR